jgi:hypothetical protein
MSKKSEAAAMKAIKPFIIGSGTMEYPIDVHKAEREAFIKGYEQAEKELLEFVKKQLESPFVAIENEYHRGVREALACIYANLDGNPSQAINHPETFALTWEDIKSIDDWISVVQTSEDFVGKELYEEVLRRFKEEKK